VIGGIGQAHYLDNVRGQAIPHYPEHPAVVDVRFGQLVAEDQERIGLDWPGASSPSPGTPWRSAGTSFNTSSGIINISYNSLYPERESSRFGISWLKYSI
jgi:hypothetical protein